MASFGNKLAKNFKLLSNINSIIRSNTNTRTLFTASACGVDNFKRQQEKYVSQSTDIELVKKRVAESDKPILTDDLKTLLYLSRNDADFDELFKAFKRFKRSSTGLTTFNFGSPIMRLLYCFNKTDLAVQLFNDPELNHIFNDQTTVFLLFNKLNEDKRYNDTVNIFFDVIEKRKELFTSKSEPKKLKFNSDITQLVVEAMYYLNNKDAITNFKKLAQIMKENSIRWPRNVVSNGILLALNQNETEFAFEAIGLFETPGSMKQNLKAITLAHIGRVKESIDVINEFVDNSRQTDGGGIFPLTMKTIRETLEKGDDKQLKETFDALSKKIISEKRLSSKDLTDLTLEVKTVRITALNRQDFGGDRQNFGFNRPQQGFGGQESGFNRSSQRFGSQQGTQSVDGEVPRFNQRNNQTTRFDQGQQQMGSRFDQNQPQRRPPPRKQINDDDDD